MLGFDQTMTVLTPAASDGSYATTITGIPCRLCVMTVGSEPGDDRAEIDSRRRLLWEPAYAIDETSRIEIDGEAWNLRPGTFAVVRGPSGTPVYRRAEAVRAI